MRDRGKIFIYLRPIWTGKSTRVIEHFLDKEKRGFILTYNRQTLQQLYIILSSQITRKFDSVYNGLYIYEDIEKMNKIRRETVDHLTEQFKSSIGMYDHKPYFSYSNYAYHSDRIYVDDIHKMEYQHQQFLKEYVSKGGNVHIYTSLFFHTYEQVVVTRYINRYHNYRTKEEFYNIASDYIEDFRSIDENLPWSILTDPRTVYKSIYAQSIGGGRIHNIKSKFNI